MTIAQQTIQEPSRFKFETQMGFSFPIASTRHDMIRGFSHPSSIICMFYREPAPKQTMLNHHFHHSHHNTNPRWTLFRETIIIIGYQPATSLPGVRFVRPNNGLCCPSIDPSRLGAIRKPFSMLSSYKVPQGWHVKDTFCKFLSTPLYW